MDVVLLTDVPLTATTFHSPDGKVHFLFSVLYFLRGEFKAEAPVETSLQPKGSSHAVIMGQIAVSIDLCFFGQFEVAN